MHQIKGTSVVEKQQDRSTQGPASESAFNFRAGETQVAFYCDGNQKRSHVFKKRQFIGARDPVLFFFQRERVNNLNMANAEILLDA